MKALLSLIWIVIRQERRALARGLALSLTVLTMGVGLLGLSGWFITASAAAGMAGIGVLFNVFAPSAMVRFLALGRTAARYGERLLTHDATLRALSALRIRLLQGLLTRPYRDLERLRANVLLNRITADIDALDGALLRLVIPAASGSVVILGATIALWFLVHPMIALSVGGGYLALPTAVFLIGQRAARRPSRQAEAALQAGRARLVDLVAGRDDLAMYGRIGAAAAHTRDAFARQSIARRRLDRIDRRTGGALDLITASVTALVLGIGAKLVQAETLTAAQAAIGVFAALALAEAIAPVRRALAEIGRMVPAARRVRSSIMSEAQCGAVALPVSSGPLRLDAVAFERGTQGAAIVKDLSLVLSEGEIMALTGPSGVGKSTVLLLAAGALEPTCGTVKWGNTPVRELPPKARVLVPQRSALIAGSIADNLRIAAPEASDDALWSALETTCLAETIRVRGGLETRLGFRGTGLSGGESRRLALARALLCCPVLLLLDEPTEGLDDDTAARVMANLRRALPDAAILMASHKPVEIAAADQVLPMDLPR